MLLRPARVVRRSLLPLIVLGLALLAGSASPRTRLMAQSDPNQAVDPAAYRDLRWRNVGPHRGGRVTAFTGVRTEPCTFYMGATGGGVWKTENCGGYWRPIADGQIATGSIGAIEVSDSNPRVVYVGTGSAAIRSNVIIGRGMYRSTNAGASWQFLGLRDAGQIGSVVVHPTDPDVVWVAALGSPYGPTDDRGIFKTTDGGKTWKKVLFVDNETGGRVVAINWSNPDEIYAGMYRGFRKGWDIVSGGPATKGGIYKSVDGGESWTKLAKGLPQTLVGKIDLAVARTNAKVVYAMVEAPGTEGGLYRSEDAGASWTLVNNSARLRARPFYFHYVDLNPKNDNEVWVNELGLHKSLDGGRTFTQVEVPHGDNHGIWFNPDDPRYALQVNDGGATVTMDGGRTWSSLLNQPTAELYMVAADEQVPYRLYAPQQDNSTLIVPSLPTVSWPLDAPEQVWGQASGCETGQIAVRPDGKAVYGVCKGEFGRYSPDTGQEKHYWVYPQNRYGHDPDEIRYRFPRQSVVLVSPHDPKVVYHASHVVHRSLDEGVTWETISPDLTAHEADKQVVPGSPITRDVTGEEVYSSIYAMAESKLERGVLWVGANDGPVHVSRDGGKTWNDVTPKELAPGGRIQTIEPSPHRKGSAYIAAYRYLREHDLAPYVYVTNDYGKTWTRLTDGKNGIPADHPTRVVREDPAQEGLLYAGTEFGAFVSFDNGRHWQTLQQNLPATPVTDIKVHHNDLVVSTMGRAFWIMDDVTPLQQIAAGLRAGAAPGATAGGHGGPEGEAQAAAVVRVAAKPFSPKASAFLFQPRDAFRLWYEASSGRWDRAEYPANGAHLDYYLAAEPAGDVTLEILDAAGTLVRTFSSAAGSHASQGMRAPRRGAPQTSVVKTVGMHRVVWDLRYPGAWEKNAPQGGADGPVAAPGRYQVRLKAGDVVETKAFTIRIDPRVVADGVTPAQLQEQFDLLIKLRDGMSEARRLEDRLQQAMEKAGVKAVSPGVGETVNTVTYASPLQKLLARVTTAPGIYEQPMLIDQFANVIRMLNRADQKPGKDAWDRYNDLAKELAAVKSEVDKLP